MNIIFFGPPGSGKGTQGKRLAAEYNLKHISFGDILRKHVKEDTEIGKKVKKKLDQGQLVDNELMSLILEDHISTTSGYKGVIFDGFPRSIEQAELLYKILKKYNLEIFGIIFLDVPTQIVENRLIERAKLEGRPDDQCPKKIAVRLRIYQDETLPVYHFYKNLNRKIHHIDGAKHTDEVYLSIKKSLE
jgi:adenylate kinase